jgi:hypothetical protein
LGNRRRPHPGAPNSQPLGVWLSGVAGARLWLCAPFPPNGGGKCRASRGTALSVLDIFCFQFVENLGKNRTFVLFLEFQNPEKTPT